MSVEVFSHNTTEARSGNLAQDLWVVIVLTLLVTWASMRFELYERVFHATRRWEELQLDELPVVLLALSLALMWFAWRRYGEATHELDRRRRTELRLAELLQENRKLTQQHVEFQEAERKRLARELHDEAGQYLNAIKTDAVALQARTAGAPEPVRRAASAIIEHTDRAYHAVRLLIQQLRPVGLDDLGLRAAIEHLVEQWQQRFQQIRVELQFTGDLDSVGEQVALALYRLTQEGMTNVARHSGATRVQLTLARGVANGVDEVRFELADNGCGLREERSEGLGLIGMRERTEMLGGRFEVRSGPGVTVCASMPAHTRGAA